jgi:hypothetical protein
MNTKPIYVILDGGLVQEILNVPQGQEVHVIDKDVEGECKELLSISPLDGEVCVVTIYESNETPACPTNA